MKLQVLTKQELHEPFFVTLGRLKTAIQQADFSAEHKARALALYDKVQREINDVSAELVEVHTRLTATDVHEIHLSDEPRFEQAREEELTDMIENHDCGTPLGDGCDVCAKYLPDYQPDQEEEEHD